MRLYSVKGGKYYSFYLMTIFWLLALIAYAFREYWWVLCYTLVALIFLLLYLSEMGNSMFRTKSTVKNISTEDNQYCEPEKCGDTVKNDATIIAPEVTVKGNINSGGMIIICGTVHGDIVSGDGFIQVIKGGIVNGDVFGREVVVDGDISGECRAEIVHIKENGNLKGKVVYNILSVDQGGILTGEAIKEEGFSECGKDAISDMKCIERSVLLSAHDE